MKSPPSRAELAAWWERRARLGGSDCEEVRPGLVAQPANTLSSLAYGAAGALVAVRAHRRGSAAGVAFGAVLGAVGVGSVLYHGPCPPGAQGAHDASLAAALGLMALHNLGGVSGHARLLGTPARAVAAVGAGAAVVPNARFTNPVVGALATLAVGSELVLLRNGRRGTAPQGVATAALVLGLATHALSRTGGPLCRPRSWWQGHAAWHVLSAAGLALWAESAYR